MCEGQGTYISESVNVILKKKPIKPSSKIFCHINSSLSHDSLPNKFYKLAMSLYAILQVPAYIYFNVQNI